MAGSSTETNLLLFSFRHKGTCTVVCTTAIVTVAMATTILVTIMWTSLVAKLLLLCFSCIPLILCNNRSRERCITNFFLSTFCDPNMLFPVSFWNVFAHCYFLLHNKYTSLHLQLALLLASFHYHLFSFKF